jgi:HEAT repeat protein
LQPITEMPVLGLAVMRTDTSLIVALFSLGLLAALTLLVLGKRVLRGLVERGSRGRTESWIIALGPGPVSEVRTKKLRSLAHEAAHRPGAQEDLLTLLQTGELPPRDARRGAFVAALHAGGFVQALPVACRSRQAVERGRAVLLWARLGLTGAERAIAPLIADPDPDVRAAATQALAICRSEEAAWILLGALREGHMAPERVVERLGGEWAAAPLLRAMRQLSYAPVRPWIAEALGLTGDSRAEPLLITMLRRGGEEHRIRACRALGRLSRRTSFTALVTALGDASASVRAQAARALADLGDARSVGPLVSLLDDDAWWVRARAADALRALGEPGLTALAHCAADHPDLFARERAAEALGLEPEAGRAADGAQKAAIA